MKLAVVTYENPKNTKLTEFVRNTTIGGKSVFECENLKEYNTAQTTAYTVKQEERADGYKYKISLDSNRMTVSVSLVKLPE